ncbi:hypothetical protein ACN47E_003678 [Coniothyrium glycines]
MFGSRKSLNHEAAPESMIPPSSEPVGEPEEKEEEEAVEPRSTELDRRATKKVTFGHTVTSLPRRYRPRSNPPPIAQITHSEIEQTQQSIPSNRFTGSPNHASIPHLPTLEQADDPYIDSALQILDGGSIHHNPLGSAPNPVEPAQPIDVDATLQLVNDLLATHRDSTLDLDTAMPHHSHINDTSRVDNVSHDSLHNTELSADAVSTHP